MQAFTVEVAGSVYALPVNFAAIKAVDERAGDPWAMVIQYSTGTPLSLLQIINTLVAGVLAGNVKVDPVTLAEQIFESGGAKHAELVRKYVFALCEGKSEHAPDAKDSTKKSLPAQ
jgi:hypothetical protein